MDVLIGRFGNVSVETTVAEVVNGRLIRNYKVGKYERVASYDYEGNVTASLEAEMENDRINFLMDLVQMILEEGEDSEIVDELLGGSAF